MRSPLASAVTLAALALLGGCSAQPGVAATVDGRTITERQLDAVHDDLSAIAPVDAPPLLRAMILSPLLLDAAETAGVGVSEAEAVEDLNAAAAAAGGDGSRAFSEETIDLRRSELAIAKMQGLPDAEALFTELVARAQALDVEVNPRYGTYDSQELAIGPTSLPWIVAPAP